LYIQYAVPLVTQLPAVTLAPSSTFHLSIFFDIFSDLQAVTQRIP
jgi:hypothetical protein